MKTAKEILEGIKALFNAPVIAATEPAVPPAPVVVPKAYKLADGTEIMVTQAGDAIAVGDIVTVAGAIPAAGELTLEDKSIIVVDATGKITELKPAAPVTTDLNNQPAPPAAPPAPVVLTAEAVNALFAKFATGTPEERIANLETMVKALMECNFGYEIRKGQEQTAIIAYKESLAPAVQEAVQAASQKFESAIEDHKKTIEEHEQTIKGLFELCEVLTKEPAADPTTLNGRKKEQFDSQNKREAKFERIAASLRAIKEEAKTQPV